LGVRLINITGNVLGSRNQNVVIEFANRVSISGNTIYDGTLRNVHLRGCQYSTLGSNTIHSRPATHRPSSSDGILLEDGVGLNVTGNILQDVHCGREESGGALHLLRCRETRVSQNQILDSKFRGIHLADSSGCVLSDNTIKGTTGETYQAAIEATGNLQGNLVQNNLISKGAKGDILMPESGGWVKGNTVV
jgi:parallel beta-helix repeat protein